MKWWLWSWPINYLRNPQSGENYSLKGNIVTRQMQLGKGDAITWGLGKMTLLSGLAPTVEACESSFVANGMEVPWASELAPWATGLPVGLALTELGLKCGEDARSKGCNVQTFAMAELLVTALVLGV